MKTIRNLRKTYLLDFGCLPILAQPFYNVFIDYILRNTFSKPLPKGISLDLSFDKNKTKLNSYCEINYKKTQIDKGLCDRDIKTNLTILYQNNNKRVSIQEDTSYIKYNYHNKIVYLDYKLELSDISESDYEIYKEFLNKSEIKKIKPIQKDKITFQNTLRLDESDKEYNIPNYFWNNVSEIGQEHLKHINKLLVKTKKEKIEEFNTRM
jgi:hypothetical protein